MLQRWLRAPFAHDDNHCPLCNSVLDKHGDHALTCCCGGDRTKRHNLLRNTFFFLLQAAGFNPEREAPGLLRPRPVIGSTREDGSPLSTDPDSNADQRRPADVLAPRWRSGIPAAFDVAVTSGLRSDYLTGGTKTSSAAI